MQTSFTEPPISRKWFTETGQIITVTSQIHGHLCILLLVNIVPFFVWHTHTTRTLFLSLLRFVVVVLGGGGAGELFGNRSSKITAGTSDRLPILFPV